MYLYNTIKHNNVSSQHYIHLTNYLNHGDYKNDKIELL